MVARPLQGTTMPPDAPTGWMWVPNNDMPGGGYFRPDVRHPMHPYNVVQRDTPKLRSWLDDDEEIQAFIAFIRRWKPEVDVKFADIRLRTTAGGTDLGILAEAAEFTSALVDEIGRASRTIGPKDISAWMKLHYLADRIAPPGVMSEYLTSVEPVGLFATLDGHITASVTGASQKERRLYNGLIDEAQRFFGHRKHAGGRPRIEDDAVATEQAKTVAKLAWMGLSTAEIGVFFAWKDNKTGEPITAKAIEHRVADYLKRGKALLSAEDPEWPQEQPLPRARPPQRKGLGPPWKS